VLQTLHFSPAAPELRYLALGILSSRNVAVEAVAFSVPGHVFATLNFVIGGSLRLAQTDTALPTAFATCAQTKAVRYVISPGATLVTLFCRCELLAVLAGAQTDAAACALDAQLHADVLFPAFAIPSESGGLASIEASMWAAVSPMHRQTPSARAAAARARARIRMDACLRELVQAPMAELAADRRLPSEQRQLQRDFARHWGMSLKSVQRMLRLQRGLQLWHTSQPHMQLAELAAALGLADQAHLAREFRELVGEPPSALKRSDAPSDALWALEQGAASLLPLFEQSLMPGAPELSGISKTGAATLPSMRR
jgi:AraC-like DNA-binding protein